MLEWARVKRKKGQSTDSMDQLNFRGRKVRRDSQGKDRATTITSHPQQAIARLDACCSKATPNGSIAPTPANH